jgi:hypothetical protein
MREAFMARMRAEWASARKILARLMHVKTWRRGFLLLAAPGVTPHTIQDPMQGWSAGRGNMAIVGLAFTISRYIGLACTVVLGGCA